MREKPIERYFVNQVKKRGGKAYKWVSPGNPGVPDRIVFHKAGFPFFVELKSSTGTLSDNQKAQHRALGILGQQVWVVNSKYSVDRMLSSEMGGGL